MSAIVWFAGKMPAFLCALDGGTGGCSNGSTFSAAAFNWIFARMQTAFARLQPENVTVQYADIGLGFAGRSGGPVPAITVCLKDMTFDTAILGGILMPQFCATLTAEDLRTEGI